MKTATLDPAKNLNLYFRRGRNGSKVLNFFETDGTTPYNISAITFTVEGVPGLTVTAVGPNTLRLNILSTQVLGRDSYFWELINQTDKRTWLCGQAIVTGSESAEATDSDDILIALNSEIVNINIDGSTADTPISGADTILPFDASNNVPPTQYNSLPIVSGNKWYTINSGSFFGVPNYPAGTIIIALVDNATLETHFRFI